MIKRLTFLMVCVLCFAVLAGCAIPDTGKPDVKEGHDAEETAEAGGIPDEMSVGAVVAESLGIFQTAEMAVTNGLELGLSLDPQGAQASLSVLGIFSAGSYLTPIRLLGVPEDFSITMKNLGNTHINYSEDKDGFALSYRDANDADYSLSGTYDASADALAVTVQMNGADALWLEYRKTSYGYAAQYLITDGDGTVKHYCLTTTGEEGALGIETAAGSIAALTGNETLEFPQGCTEWYLISETEITGVGPDGASLRFNRTQ